MADIRFLREGTISGTVLNGQGVPIGARVRLTGIGPLPNGKPGFIIRGERNSDPALGTFEFPGQAFVGDWGLQAASPFFPVVISDSGRTTSINPNDTNRVLQFPADRETKGRLGGTVFQPDGVTRVGSNVNVKISFGNDFIIRTRGDGTFDTQIGLNAINGEGQPGVGYTVEADDPTTGLRGQASVIVFPTGTNAVKNFVNVRLLGKGALAVTVLNADGTAAVGASIDLEQGSYPQERFQGTNDASGGILFQNLFEGQYAVCAQMISGPTRIFGRVSASVARGGTNNVTLQLGPTGAIKGRFVKRDLVTPVTFAQVAVGNIGFTTTDTNGAFFVGGLPLGTYRLSSQDPVTGIGASLNVTLNFVGQTNEVQLVEQSRGEVRGFVVNSYATGFVPGAQVTISFADGLTPRRTVTSGPDGGFSFPGTPAGAFSLEAEDPVTNRRGNNNGVLPENAALFQIDVPLQSLATLAGQVFVLSTNAPATNATVKFTGNNFTATADTDSTGRVSFVDLPLGSYVVRASALGLEETRSAVEANVSITAAGSAPEFTLILPGVGGISGTVFLSDGLTPAVGATVVLAIQSPLFPSDTENTLTDVSGRFDFTNVAVGPYRLTAQAAALGVSFNGSIGGSGELDEVTLTVGASGTAHGRLVRADGSTPMPGIDVLLTFASQSGLPGRAAVRTDGAGLFNLSNIPIGTFNFEAIAFNVGGIARLTATLSSNGQVLDLGDVRLDEDDPRVVIVTPPNTAVGIPITTTVELLFGEALATNSLDTNGIYLRLNTSTNNAPASVELLPDPTNGIPRLVRITPLAPLQSEKTYEVIVIDGERKNALGSVIGKGPTDLIGRPLVTPFISSFTTADNDPPRLLSIFPTNNRIQIDPRAVLRLAFNEPIRVTNYFFSLVGPDGPVAGTNSVGLNGLVLVFASDAPLKVNATYTLTVSNVFDLAGNRAANEPFVANFATLDTLGPNIAQLRIADGRAPVASGTIPVEAVLAAAESSVSVRFTQDLKPLSADSSPPFRANLTLPASGSTTARATATDRFGNDGPFAELVINVVSNQPPTISFARGTPASGPLTNGQAFSLLVSAADDLGVTNVTVVGLGAVPFVTNFTSGAQQTLGFVVPSNTPVGGLFQFRAQATDALGAKSSEALVDLEVIDGLPPTLVVLSPADNALLNPAQPLNLVMASSDNTTNHTLEVALSGALTATQTLSVAASPFVPVTNTFTFSLANAPSNGASLVATVRAADSAGNTTTASRTFRLPDTRPPQLVSASPTNEASRQSLWLSAVFDFDEPLDPASVTTNTVVVTNSAGTPTPFGLSLANGDRRVNLSLARPLQPAVSYTNILLPDFADTSSNRWQNVGGEAVPAAGVAFTFTTAAIFDSAPTNGTRVIAGQNVTVTANYEAGLGASLFRFQFENNAPVQVAAGSTSAVANITIPTNAPTGPGSISISASPDTSFNEAFAFAPVILEVRPLDGDEDGDGMPNSFEIANQLDPFVNDAALDPDSDGLTNLQEFQFGTLPRDPDTDHDGLSDGGEVALGCTSPLNPDSDGDGLPDGIDPNPCNLATGLTFTAPATFDLVEGTTTNLIVQVASTNSQILLLDYSPTNPPPMFVSVKSRSFNNTPTNGVASLELEFNPLHDAAGEHLLRLRAAAANGESGTITVRLIVADDPSLIVTRWKDPVDGDWNDASKWTDGVPIAGKVAVIDAIGAYNVSLNASVDATGIVLDHTNAVLRPTTSVTLNAPVELRGGLWEIVSSTTLTLNRPLVNQGTLRWISAFNVFNLQGSGRVENEGLWEIFQDSSGNFGSESVVRVPVNVPAGGTLLVSTNGRVNFAAGSSLTVAGQLEIQPGARLRLENSSPARDVTLAASSSLTGTGTIQLEGSCRLLVPGDLDASVEILLFDSARLIVPGTYTIRTSRSLTGTLDAGAVIVASNATLTASSATFTGPVTVEEGGRVRMTGGTVSFQTNVLVAAGGQLDAELSSPAVVINGVLTNRGQMKWISAFNVFNLQGSGRVENEGLWEIFQDSSGNFGSESVVRVPVNVPAGGTLLVSTNGRVNFAAGSSLTVAGQLEIQPGARLRLENSSPARDLTLASGSTLSGAGTVLLEGANRVALTGDVTFGIGLLDMTGSSSITGAAKLTMATGSELRFDHSSTIPGSVTVDGTLLIASSSVTLTINGTLTLNASGTLDNSALGRIQVGVGKFINNGGTILGNPPEEIALGPNSIQITAITLSGSTPLALQKAQATPPPREVLIKWSGRSRQVFVIESSADLRRWNEAPVTTIEIAPGSYQGRLTMPAEAQQFFRVRLVPRDPPENRLGRPYQPR